MIRGSTTIVEILRSFPDGEAAELMRKLYWPCAHCGGALREPLTMAAVRHRNPPRAVLEAFRALERGELSDEHVAAAGVKVARAGRLPLSALPWHRELVPWPRRLRVRFGGETVADTRGAVLLRQHGFLPVFWLPGGRRARRPARAEHLDDRSRPIAARRRYWHLRVGERVAESAAWTYPEPRAGSPDLRGYVSLDFHSMDAWYEEEERIYVHARDPYLRADARRSSRHVVAEVGGVVVADTRRPVLLDETGLITRYYVPLADVRRDLLEPSATFTECPYKGRAAYWSVRARRAERRAAAARRRLVVRPPAAGRRGDRRARLLLAGARATPCCASTARCSRGRSGRPAAMAREAIPAWRARYVQPPPASMRGVARRRPGARLRAPQQPRRGPARGRHGHGGGASGRHAAVALVGTRCVSVGPLADRVHLDLLVDRLPAGAGVTEICVAISTARSGDATSTTQ